MGRITGLPFEEAQKIIEKPGMTHCEMWAAWYKEWIIDTEERVVYYKKLMQEIHKDPRLQIDWFKEMTREDLNYNQKRLKELLDDYQWYKNGMEPSYRK